MSVAYFSKRFNSNSFFFSKSVKSALTSLEIIRNTIYARHGLSFKKKTFRQFYDPVDWYIPVSKDVSADLTDLEKKNELLLKRFEKYATDNYDYYGR